MKLAVIGCGQMASAWMSGVIRAGVVSADQVWGYARSEASRARFRSVTHARTADSLEETLRDAEVVLLCMKPHDVPAALVELAGCAPEPKLVISIAAGLALASLEAGAPAGFRFVRVMPNTPAMVGKGASAYCLGTHANEADDALVRSLLEAVGIAVAVGEHLMDAVTGVAGSGPAYGFMIIEALADGGVRVGLPRAAALKLAAQTIAGAAAMVLETGDHPAVLRDRVASPGGTTIAGIAALEAGGLRHTLIEAVLAASRRAAELAKLAETAKQG